MPKRLKDLVITKVSLVPKGSNPDADITLFKSADPVAKITFNEVLEGHPDGVREALWKIYDLCYAFNSTTYANLVGGKNVVSDMEKSIQQFSDAVKDALSEINITKSTKASADAVQRAVLVKAREFVAAHQEDTPVADKKREDMSKDELLAEIAKIETTAKKTDPPAAPTADDLLKEMKDLPPVVKQALELQQAQITKANAEIETAKAAAAAATETARVEKEARELQEMTAYVKAELAHIPGKPEDIAKGLLESKSKLTKESYDLVIASMKAGSTGIAKSLTVAGVDDVQAALGGAYEKLSAIAKTAVEKDTTGKLTFELAFEKAMTDNPELYKEYRDERARR